MAWTKLWVIGFRDLLRNRRRTFFTLLAVALGLALLIVLNGFIAGILDDALTNSIRLQTGHLQVRAESYEDGRRSLQWKDLLDQPAAIATQAAADPAVAAATPVLWSDTILSTSDESVGLQLYGIDPTSAMYDPIRASLVAGNFIEDNDRGGVLLGKRLADSLGLKLGENVSLTAINSNGEPEEGLFAVRGIFDSGVLVYDEATIFMPLSKAQAFTLTGDRASAIVMLLHDENAADQVAATLAAPGRQVLTWRDLNAVFLETMGTAMSFYWILDGIVMLIVAVIIANTLLMAVFERIREMGILSALGMKRRQIMQMMIFEASIICPGRDSVRPGAGAGERGTAHAERLRDGRDGRFDRHHSVQFGGLCQVRRRNLHVADGVDVYHRCPGVALSGMVCRPAGAGEGAAFVVGAMRVLSNVRPVIALRAPLHRVDGRNQRNLKWRLSNCLTRAKATESARSRHAHWTACR